jgi:hypothetical protein
MCFPLKISTRPDFSISLWALYAPNPLYMYLMHGLTTSFLDPYLDSLFASRQVNKRLLFYTNDEHD